MVLFSALQILIEGVVGNAKSFSACAISPHQLIATSHIADHFFNIQLTSLHRWNKQGINHTF